MKSQNKELENIKLLNNISFPYSDREINSVNLARNKRDGYEYLTIDNKQTGILFQYIENAENNIQRSKLIGQGIVIELPACAVDQGSPISDRLKEQLEHLKKFTTNHSNQTIYPIKILFPYKLQGWHWNVGEIIIQQNNTVSGCTYDSYGSVGPLEIKIQKEIEQTFKNHYSNQITFNFSKEKEEIKKVQTGIACGLYAGIAMHNLKTKTIANIWDGIFNNNERKTEEELRNIDNNLIFEHNKTAINSFCKPINESDFIKPSEVGKINIKDQKNIEKAKESLSQLNNKDKSDLIKHLTIFNQSTEDYTARLDELFKNLNDNNNAKNLIFTLNKDGLRDKLKIATEILELLPLSLRLSMASDKTNSTNKKNEDIFGNCIQLIDDSFRLEIYKIAINSTEKIENSLLKKTQLTQNEQSIKAYFESTSSFINEIKEEEDKEILMCFLYSTLNEAINQVNEQKESKQKQEEIEQQNNPRSNNQPIIDLDSSSLSYTEEETSLPNKTIINPVNLNQKQNPIQSILHKKGEKENKERKRVTFDENENHNNQLIINQDNKILFYQDFEVVICNNKPIQKTLNQQKTQIKSILDEETPDIPDIKEDIDYAFCKQNQQNNQAKALKSQNNTNLASHNFGFRFNSEAGKLINTVNSDSSDEAKNTAWEKLLTEHDTVIFKLASDRQNYIRFYLNRGKDGKIEFAFDECLFSKADALELSRDFTKYDKIKAESTTKISKDERFDIYLYCKSGPKETDKDNEVLKAEFNSNNQQPQNKISNISLDKKNQSISAIKID